MNEIKFVFVCCSALLLSVPSARAEKQETKKLQEISTEAPTSIRSTQASLAGLKGRSLAAPSRQKATRAVQEQAVVSQANDRKSRIKQAKPLTPYQAAFQALKVKANVVNPSLGGRINVSFTIDRQGKPGKIVLFGFNAEMDKALAEVLAQQQFPKADRGQFYSSKLSIVATKKPARVAKKTKKRRRR